MLLAALVSASSYAIDVHLDQIEAGKLKASSVIARTSTVRASE
jgi:hypothetical protein